MNSPNVVSFASAQRARKMGEMLDSIADSAEHLRTCSCIVDAVNTITVMQVELDMWLDMQADELMIARDSIDVFLDAARRQLEE